LNEREKLKGNYPNCEFEKGTLEEYRMRDVCQIVKKNWKYKSDDNGDVSFGNFMLERGPEGEYFLQYVHSSSLKSERLSIFVASEAIQLEVVAWPSNEAYYTKIGESFDPQPQIRVLGFNNTPISGNNQKFYYF
jgi:hypothetical protein